MKTINIAVEVCCIVSLVVFIVAVIIESKTERRGSLYFILLFSSIAAVMLSNIMGLVTRGGGNRAAVCAANFFEFAFQVGVSFVFALYVLYELFGGYGSAKDKPQKWLYYAVFGMFAAGLALIVVSQFTGLYYVIDENNIYRRSALFPLSVALGMLPLVFCMVLVIVYRRRLPAGKTAMFFVYIVLPLVAAVIQPFVYDFYVIIYSMQLASVIMFVFMLYNRAEERAKAQHELAKLQTQIMLSQIQPHFLYNSLSSISALCDSDPKLAKSAIASFSDYLRANMSALKSDAPIPFSDELKHIKTYIYLEELRYGKGLTVEYDISSDGFFVPALSVQPIVENAVQYSVGLRRDRGRIKLSALDRGDRFEVTVEDDGVGFDPAAATDDGKPHIGIENVRRRLEAVCGGRLDISSVPEKGTTVTIVIPKEGNV